MRFPTTDTSTESSSPCDSMSLALCFLFPQSCQECLSDACYDGSYRSRVPASGFSLFFVDKIYPQANGRPLCRTSASPVGSAQIGGQLISVFAHHLCSNNITAAPNAPGRSKCRVKTHLNRSQSQAHLSRPCPQCRRQRSMLCGVIPASGVNPDRASSAPLPLASPGSPGNGQAPAA